MHVLSIMSGWKNYWVEGLCAAWPSTTNDRGRETPGVVWAPFVHCFDNVLSMVNFVHDEAIENIQYRFSFGVTRYDMYWFCFASVICIIIQANLVYKTVLGLIKVAITFICIFACIDFIQVLMMLILNGEPTTVP